MNLNPFVRFTVKCRFSAEQAMHRFSLVTKERSMLSPSWRISPFSARRSCKRYVGKVSETRFTVTKPTDNTLAKVLDIPYQNLVIHGKVLSGSSGCTIKVLIRPTLNILLAWLVLPVVFLVLASGIVPDIGHRESVAGSVFCLLMIFVVSREYIVSFRTERQFVVELFEAGTPTPSAEPMPTV